jgi:hypothetical protein
MGRQQAQWLGGLAVVVEVAAKAAEEGFVVEVMAAVVEVEKKGVGRWRRVDGIIIKEREGRAQP